MADVTSSQTSIENRSADDVHASSSQSTQSTAAADSITPTASASGHHQSNLVLMRPVSRSAGNLPTSYNDEPQRDKSAEADWASVEGISSS